MAPTFLKYLFIMVGVSHHKGGENMQVFFLPYFLGRGSRFFFPSHIGELEGIINKFK